MKPSPSKLNVMKLMAGLAASLLISSLAGCAAKAPAPSVQTAAQLGNVYHTPEPAFATSVDLQKFQDDDDGDYYLGAGDIVSVTIWGHPELSGKHTIGPDGKIQIPLIGSVQIVNLTAGQASQRLMQVMSELYTSPVASVQIDSYVANRVIVLGRVANPGVMEFNDTPTLLEVLARAGAPAGPATTPQDKGAVNQSASYTRCAIVRGRDRVLWVDLRPLLDGDDISANIRLRPNDLVYVPASEDRLVYVMGQVTTPGAYPLTPNMSFLEAISKAGGPTDNAQPGKIVLARPSQNLKQVVDLNKLVQGNGDSNYTLQQGDIIYVPKNGMASVGYVLQQLNPLTTMLFLGTAL